MFVFSRAGCDAAVQQLLGRGTRLIPEEEGRRIRDLVSRRAAEVDPADAESVLAEQEAQGDPAHEGGPGGSVDRAELFVSVRSAVRIDRDFRPLFDPAALAFGGAVNEYPDAYRFESGERPQWRLR